LVLVVRAARVFECQLSVSSEQLAVLMLCLAGCALNEQLCGGGRGNLQRESAHVQRAFSPCRYSNAANRSKNDARAQRYVAAPRSLHRSFKYNL